MKNQYYMADNIKKIKVKYSFEVHGDKHFDL